MDKVYLVIQELIEDGNSNYKVFPCKTKEKAIQRLKTQKDWFLDSAIEESGNDLSDYDIDDTEESFSAMHYDDGRYDLYLSIEEKELE